MEYADKLSQRTDSPLSMALALDSLTLVSEAATEPAYSLLNTSLDLAPISTAAPDDNTTLNATAPAGPSFYQFQNEQLVFQILLFLFIMIGNTAVLLAIGLSKRGRSSRMNFFIMHLALADLSVGIFSVLTDIVWKMAKAWYAGNAMCKIIRYMQCVVLYGSTYVLVALSLDRLDAIARPMSFTGSGTRAKILVGTAWLFSFAFSVPMLFINEERIIYGVPQCWIVMSPSHWQIYITSIAVLVLIIPALIIAVCYLIIIRIIWSKSKEIRPAKRVTNFKMTNITGYKSGGRKPEAAAPSCTTSSRGVIPLAKVKTIKMTLVIVLMFILCWSPFFIYDILDVFKMIPPSQSKVTLSIFIQSLAPLNSFANPLIYGLFSSRICQNLRRLPGCNALLRRLSCCCCVEERSEQPNTSVYSAYSTINAQSSVNRRSHDVRTGGSRALGDHSGNGQRKDESETVILMSGVGNGYCQDPAKKMREDRL